MESTQKQPPNCIEPIPCQWGAIVGAVPSIEMRVAVYGVSTAADASQPSFAGDSKLSVESLE